jgi:transcription initiation factor TFIIIB Brf1 subunit/transcription initiation factor TFIIB
MESNITDISHPDEGHDHSKSTHHTPQNKNHHDYGLGTNLSFTDHKNTKLDTNTVFKLNKTNSITRQTGPDRSLIQYMQEIEFVKNQLHLSKNITDEVIYQIRKAVSKGLVRWQPIRLTITSLVYIVAKNNGIHYTKSEMQRVCDSKFSTFTKHCLDLKEKLNLENNYSSGIQYHLNKICDAFDGTIKVKSVSSYLAKYCEDKELITGRKPQAVAAAIFYLVNKQYGRDMVTIDDLKASTHTAYYTVARTIDKLRPVLEGMINQDGKKKIIHYREET